MEKEGRYNKKINNTFAVRFKCREKELSKKKYNLWRSTYFGGLIATYHWKPCRARSVTKQRPKLPVFKLSLPNHHRWKRLRKSSK